MFENEACFPLVISEGATIKGYTFLILVLDEIHLTNIGIAKKYQKSGLGQKLLGYVIDWGKSNYYQHIYLEVRVTNEPAINLYLKNGFIKSGIRKEYYPDNKEDALLMMKTL